MKRKLLALFLFFSVLAGIGFYADTQPDRNVYGDTPVSYNAQEIYANTQDAVFYIRALGKNGVLKNTGTGVMISPDGTAATAYHVVTDADKLEGIFNDGRIVTGIRVLRYDELTDAAVLKLPLPAGKEAAYAALEIRNPAVLQGEKVFAIGYPLKQTPIITEGIVNSPAAKINGRSVILASAQVVSGMSGGPLIDQYGRLAGILSGSLRTMDAIHLVVGTADLRSLLQAQAKPAAVK
ncbi:serine protease [Paenibacillus sepulcri]|uniref:Serine protease n=1 Tax=Paenibacillus sepulcri TaxID=359917 RepID=A0ABS7C809_9BACL|nr:serine protease [Paenibacillus sepulcri]